MIRSAMPLPLLRLWYDLLFLIRLKIGIWNLCTIRKREANWLAVRLPALLVVGVLVFQGFNVPALIKLLLAGTTYLVISSTMRILCSKRAATAAGSLIVIASIAVNIIEPVGQYDEIVPRAQFVVKPQKFRTKIYTHPRSPRWQKIKSADADLYLFVSSPATFTGDMVRVSINGVDYGRMQDIPGAVSGSGAWTVPLDWSVIGARDIVEIILDLKPGPDGGWWLAASVDVPATGRPPVQHFKFGNGPWREVSDVLEQPQAMSVELRIADKQRRNLGILF